MAGERIGGRGGTGQEDVYSDDARDSDFFVRQQTTFDRQETAFGDADATNFTGDLPGVPAPRMTTGAADRIASSVRAPVCSTARRPAVWPGGSTVGTPRTATGAFVCTRACTAG